MVHIFYVPMRIWQTCSLFAWSELLCTNKVFNPIHYSLLIYPMLIPFHTRIDKILHPLFPYFPPPPLSAWGLTRRCNSAGLAELRGGWPIELDKHCQGQDHISLFATSCVRMREYLNPWGCWYFLVYTSRILMVHVFCIFYLKFCTSKI